jgi:hypothetical protein
MKLQFDGSADLMMNMVGAMVIMLAVFMPLAQLEQLTLLQNQSAELSGGADQPDAAELALVEIQAGRDGHAPVFLWRGKDGSESERLDDFDALRDRLRTSRPAGIRLRIERQVPSGIYQDLVIDAYDLGIAILQSNRRED